MLLLLSLSSSLVLPAHASGAEWGPWDKDKAYLREEAPVADRNKSLLRSIAASPGMMLISFFQTVVSPVDGATCTFYPTCSDYARQALKKHGLIIGLTMASERLCRDHTFDGYQTIIKYGGYYSYDPVENNDFWFTGKTGWLP